MITPIKTYPKKTALTDISCSRNAYPAPLPRHFFKKQLIMSSDRKQPAFTAPIERHTFAGVLLDLDGTLVDSKDAITKHWHKYLNLIGFVGTIYGLMLIFFFS